MFPHCFQIGRIPNNKTAEKRNKIKPRAIHPAGLSDNWFGPEQLGKQRPREIPICTLFRGETNHLSSGLPLWFGAFHFAPLNVQD